MFRSNRFRYGATMWSLGLLVWTYLVSLGWTLYEIFLTRGKAWVDTENIATLYQLLVAFEVTRTSRLILVAACALFFLVWLRAACRLARHNARVDSFEASPTWAVTSFVLPVVNLFAPYRVLAGLWDRSRYPHAESGDQRGLFAGRNIVLLWWLGFVATTLLAFTHPAMPDSTLYLWGRAAYFGVAMATSIAAMSMVRSIHSYGEQHRSDGGFVEAAEARVSVRADNGPLATTGARLLGE